MEEQNNCAKVASYCHRLLETGGEAEMEFDEERWAARLAFEHRLRERKAATIVDVIPLTDAQTVAEFLRYVNFYKDRVDDIVDALIEAVEDNCIANQVYWTFLQRIGLQELSIQDITILISEGAYSFALHQGDGKYTLIVDKYLSPIEVQVHGQAIEIQPLDEREKQKIMADLYAQIAIDTRCHRSLAEAAKKLGRERG